jgi:hypothetical protein
LGFDESLRGVPSPRNTAAAATTSRKTAAADPIKVPYRTDPREFRQIATHQLYASP